MRPHPHVSTKKKLVVALVVAAGALFSTSLSTARASVSQPTSVEGASAELATASSCRVVSSWMMKNLATGLNHGRRFSGRGVAVPSGDRRTPWFIAARVSGAGIAVWATDLGPSITKLPSAGGFIQAANGVAWRTSEWGVLGSFPRNYPTAPVAPPLSSPGIPRAIACVR
jgi:hypothetical protein